MRHSKSTRSANGHSTEFTEKLNELSGLLGDLTKMAPDAAGEALEDLKQRAHELCDNCGEKACGATKAVVHTVREHPVPFAAAAAGAGLLAWWLISRYANQNSDAA